MKCNYIVSRWFFCMGCDQIPLLEITAFPLARSQAVLSALVSGEFVGVGFPGWK
jgi:hypothetical protein